MAAEKPPFEQGMFRPDRPIGFSELPSKAIEAALLDVDTVSRAAISGGEIAVEAHLPEGQNNTLDVANEIAGRRPPNNPPQADGRAIPLPLEARSAAGAATGVGMSLVGNENAKFLDVDFLDVPPTRPKVDDVQPPPALSVTPTIYPDQPGSSPVVNNYITVNVASADFSALESTIATLVKALAESKSNTMSSDTAQQLAAEIKAGFELLRAPQASVPLVKTLLVGPLKYVTVTAAGTVIAVSAHGALELIGKLTGWW
jgi:hypothetical protein